MFKLIQRCRPVNKVSEICSASLSDKNKNETFTVKKRSEILEEKKLKNESSKVTVRTGPPEVPTTCCQSGCPNCVWLDYAEELSKYYQDGGKEAIATIHKDIEDPNLREFILFELRMKNIS